jgi:hypothetical protein
MRPLARLLIALLLNLAGGAWASAQGVCTVELGGELAGVSDPAIAAPLLLARMLQLIEPAYPVLRRGEAPMGGVAERLAGDPMALARTELAIEYLHQRRYLPAGWSVAGHSHEAWRTMLGDFLHPYRAPLPGLSPPEAGAAGMLVDATRVLAVAAEAVRPAAVLAFDGELRPTLSVMVWNWTSYPRLIVHRPKGEPAGATLDEAIAATLAAMGNCALRLHYYLAAPEQLAFRFFLRQGASTLRLLAVDSAANGAASALLPLDFDSAAAMAVIAFEAPQLSGVERYSAAVLGPSPLWTDVLQAVFSSKRNISIGEAFTLLALP